MLTPDQVAEAFRRLQSHAPDRGDDPHVKEDPDPFRALVACLLSGQSRDANTAKARDALFGIADTPEAILALPDARIAQAIRPAGLYNTKTRRLKALCRAVIARGGTVPRDRAGLMTLPGIGRKCADIMLRFSYDQPAIAVDTHVHRVCNRTGLAAGRTEAQTAEVLDRRAPAWAKRGGHLWLLDFGKQVCTGRAPKCPTCYLGDLCKNPVRPGGPRTG